jgi:transcriptional regulator with XRE-family HTH domain
MASVDDWTRLGEAVTRRRAYLGYTTRQQFADGTGFPAKTLSDLEKHRRDNFDRSTYGRLERALRWPNGAIESILAGGPTPLEVHTEGPADGAYLRELRNRLAADPDPLSSKLERLADHAHDLNPADLRRLGENVQTLIEWAAARRGEPEMDPEQLQALQRATAAADRAATEHAEQAPVPQMSRGRRPAEEPRPSER